MVQHNYQLVSSLWLSNLNPKQALWAFFFDLSLFSEKALNCCVLLVSGFHPHHFKHQNSTALSEVLGLILQRVASTETFNAVMLQHLHCKQSLQSYVSKGSDRGQFASLAFIAGAKNSLLCSLLQHLLRSFIFTNFIFLFQRNSFMNGTKHVAIISDAASTGELHSVELLSMGKQKTNYAYNRRVLTCLFYREISR